MLLIFVQKSRRRKERQQMPTKKETKEKALSNPSPTITYSTSLYSCLYIYTIFQNKALDGK